MHFQRQDIMPSGAQQSSTCKQARADAEKIEPVRAGSDGDRFAAVTGELTTDGGGAQNRIVVLYQGR